MPIPESAVLRKGYKAGWEDAAKGLTVVVYDGPNVGKLGRVFNRGYRQGKEAYKQSKEGATK